MPFACSPAQFISNLASLAPHFDEGWLHDWSPMESAFNGKHETAVWKLGTGDAHIRTRITIGFPNLQAPKQQINSANCTDSCHPPTDHVAFGSNRSEHYMDQWAKNTQPFCITQLRYQYDPIGQMKEIITGLKKITNMETSAYIRTRAFTKSERVVIAGPVDGSSDPIEFVPNIGVNVDTEMTVIDLGSAANLPTSRLTFPFLDYVTTIMDLGGYHEKPSGLARGVLNLITDKREWYNLTNGNASMKNMMALTETGQASGLYKIGQGIQVPFGNYAPSIDIVPAKFQLMPGGSGGLLNQVQPMINVQTGTTGTMQIPNPAYIKANYQLSFIWHPLASIVHTPQFKAIHPLIPTINSSFFGQWRMVNDAVMVYENPDGTTCTMNNVDLNQFYLRVLFEMGFEYIEPNMVLPILHRTDQSGKCQITNDIPCCDAVAYVAQVSDDPIMCIVP